VPGRFVVVVTLLAGCASNRGAFIEGGDEVGARVPGLYPCTVRGREVVEIDANRPLTVLVHGCKSSGERFKTLSQVFEAHGQQTICFNYNDRDSINTSATQLASALSSLQKRLEPHEITVLGHSQGGLISRRALQADLRKGLVTREGFTYRLVTVSSPFSGINASKDCGKTWLHVLSLSITVGVCLAVTGNKWTEIFPGSKFLNNPAPLVGTSHLQILTDERETCRTRRPDGRCAIDDFVFGLEEQDSAVVNASANVTSVTVRAGHAEVVGEDGAPPLRLIEVLQRQGVLAETPAEGQPALSDLLGSLYR
jgi:pimeloyl-ACP methyl ester carboxylesterase